MVRNFQFDSITILLFEGQAFDLHNAYDLVGCGTDLLGTEAVLDFVRNEYAFPHDPARIRITCRGSLRYMFNNLVSDEPDTGFEMAYFNEGDPWEFFVPEHLIEKNPFEVSGFHILTGKGPIVRIACDLAVFEVVDQQNVVTGPWES